MSGVHWEVDEQALLARAKRDATRRLDDACLGMRDAAGRRLDTGALVRRHPLVATGSAVVLGFLGVKIGKHLWRTATARPAPAAQPAPAPAVADATAGPATGRSGRGLMGLLINDVLIPFISAQAVAFMRRPAATDDPDRPERPDGPPRPPPPA